jgi:hypothetical protein
MVFTKFDETGGERYLTLYGYLNPWLSFMWWSFQGKKATSVFLPGLFFFPAVAVAESGSNKVAKTWRWIHFRLLMG